MTQDRHYIETSGYFSQYTQAKQSSGCYLFSWKRVNFGHSRVTMSFCPASSVRRSPVTGLYAAHLQDLSSSKDTFKICRFPDGRIRYLSKQEGKEIRKIYLASRNGLLLKFRLNHLSAVSTHSIRGLTKNRRYHAEYFNSQRRVQVKAFVGHSYY